MVTQTIYCVMHQKKMTNNAINKYGNETECRIRDGSL